MFIFTMCLFALSMSISPGPVNIITFSTGVNHGFKKAIPFVSGATFGFTILLFLIGLGLGEIAATNQKFLSVLSFFGAIFLIYMGYKISTAQPNLKVKSTSIVGFYQGFILQWLNPKAWIACLAGVSAFDITSSFYLLFIFVSLYFVICYGSIASWAYAGSKARILLQNPKYLRFLNLLMGVSLISVALYLLYQQHQTY